MFQSNGDFQNAYCPFYQYGLCHRPYCHFKHKKKELKANPAEVEKRTPSPSYLTVNKLQKNSAEDDDVMKIIKNATPAKLIEYAKRQQEEKNLRATLEKYDAELKEKEKKETKKLPENLNYGLVDAFYSRNKVEQHSESSTQQTLHDITPSLGNVPPPGKIICECDDPDCSGYIDDPELASQQVIGSTPEDTLTSERGSNGIESHSDMKNNDICVSNSDPIETKEPNTKKQKMSDLEFFVDPQKTTNKKSKKKKKDKVKKAELLDNILDSIDDSMSTELPQSTQTSSTLSSTTTKLQESTISLGKKKRVAHSSEQVVRNAVQKSSSKKISYISPSLAASTTNKSTTEQKPAAPEVTASMSYTTQDGVYVGKKRTAHAISPPVKQQQQKQQQVKRPRLPLETGGKVPHLLRQKYLDKIIDELLPKVKSELQAIEKGFEEEKVAHQRCTRKQIYLNLCANIIKKVRAMPNYTPPVVSQPQEASPLKAAQTTIDTVNRIKGTTIGGYQKVESTKRTAKGLIKAPSSTLISAASSVKKTSATQLRRPSTELLELNETNLYNHLRKEYILTTDQMWDNNYPKLDDENDNKVHIKDYIPRNTKLKRLCCRCGKEYYMNAKGKYITKEECQFHWGKLRKQKVLGNWGKYFSCCQEDASGQPCSVSRLHVCDRVGELTGFQSTHACENEETKQKVFAMDCEMCYTSEGLELTRLTVVDFNLEQIIDLFVKPDNPIVDYNTRFSGVTKELLQGVTTRMTDVHDILTNLIDKQTILLGHSLESDLKALKMVHGNVVDTALVFPHRLGLPFKRALRNLMADHLQKIIQDGEAGHDSCEDARACMELMKYKFKEDIKKHQRNNIPLANSKTSSTLTKKMMT